MNADEIQALRYGAANMFDGGWRSTDRAGLFDEYKGMTDEMADIIIEELRRIEDMLAEEEA